MSKRPPARKRKPGELPAPRPPQALGPHLRSAFRETFTQRVEGWRVRALIVVLIGGVGGGAAIAHAAGIGGAAEAGIQLGLIALIAAALATLVGLMRWRNARRG